MPSTVGPDSRLNRPLYSLLMSYIAPLAPSPSKPKTTNTSFLYMSTQHTISNQDIPASGRSNQSLKQPKKQLSPFAAMQYEGTLAQMNAISAGQ